MDITVRIIKIDKDYRDGFPQKTTTSLRNLTGIVVSEESKQAPLSSGALASTGRVVKNSDTSFSAVFGGIPGKVGNTAKMVSYAALRNRISSHPNYMELGLQNALSGNIQRWWKAS